MPPLSDQKTDARLHGAGRPTIAGAQAIPARILGAATELFVELGFEATSMDLIARRANVSKRTLYARFQSKDEVFLAAVDASSRRKVAELEAFRIRSRTLRTSLEEISKKLISSIVEPELVAFENIIAAEARRFPDLAEERSREGMERLTSMICAVLRKYPPFETMDAAAVELDAKIFLAMTVLPALRRAIFSDGAIGTIDMDFIEQSVAIFIRGTTASDSGETAQTGEGEPRPPASVRKQAESAKRSETVGQNTRERILQAAMHRFSQASYDDTGLRDIAADAGVDVAYVHRSFGSKEALFVRALETASGDDRLASLTSGADLPETVASLFSESRHRRGTAVQPLDIVIRSLGSPVAAAVLRQKMLADLVAPLAARLDNPSDTRAAMIVAVLVGTGVATSLLHLPGLAYDDGAAEAMLRKIIEAIVATRIT